MRPYYFDFAQTHARRARAIAMARPLAWHRAPPSPPPRGNGPAGWFRAGLELIELWHRRLRERRDLAGLDHRMQRDIGVTPSEVAHEANKPFWRG